MRAEETIILVPSCYKYRDCWKPFMTLLQKFWTNRRFLAILVTDQIGDETWNGDSHYSWGSDYGWCQNLARAVAEESQQGVKNIILLQEDFFLNKPVDSEFIDYVIRLMDTDHIGACRLIPMPGADLPYKDETRIGEVSAAAPYRVSCQATLWNANYLLSILMNFQKIFQFEILGTQYSRTRPEKILAVKREDPNWPFQYICTAIVDGKWQSGAVAWCKANGIDLDLSLRPIE